MTPRPDGAARRPRAVLLTNVISPLHVPLFAQVHARGHVELIVLFLNENESTRRWSEDPAAMPFPYEILSRRVRARASLIGGVRVDRALRRTLAYRPDVIIAGGWREPEIVGTLLATAPLRIPAVISSASTRLSRRPRWRWLPAAKRALARRFSAGIAPGPLQVDYLADFGLPRDRIFTAPYSVPGELYRAAAADPLPLAGDPALLFVGRLTDEKGLDLLIEALSGLAARPTLHLVGEGPEEAALRALAAGSPAADRIVFHGFQPREQIGRFLAGADLFVLPSSTEAWGLVLNEAMEVGTPILASDVVGAAPVLALPGETGDVFRSGDVADLRRALDGLLVDRERLAAMGERAREVVAGCNVDVAAQGWEAAVAAALGRPFSRGISGT